jgi:hypothetical protein
MEQMETNGKIVDFTKLKQMLGSNDKELQGLGFNILCNKYPNRKEYREFRRITYAKKSNNIHLKFHRRLRREVNRNYTRVWTAALKIEQVLPQN